MIKLYGRMLPMLARVQSKPTIPANQSVATRFKVLPLDIDINRHLNNGRYLQLMDINRAEWLMRTGIWKVIRNNRWRPVLGSVAINYQRELKLWDCATMETRLLGWDDRWTYLEHRIVSDAGRSVALAIAKAGFQSRGRWVNPEILRLQLPYPLKSMTLPAHARSLFEFDQTIIRENERRLQVVG